MCRYIPANVTNLKVFQTKENTCDFAGRVEGLEYNTQMENIGG